MKKITFAVIFSLIVFGFGFANSAFAGSVNVPIDITSLGDEVGIAATDNINVVSNPAKLDITPSNPDVTIGSGSPVGLMASSDLEIDNVGTLPTSYFYFFKEWGRGIDRLFTWRAVSKVKLELKITNEKAAELLAVEKANPDDTGALKNALENYSNAQERLNMRIGKLPATSNPNVAKLLEDIDAKTAKHVALLEQLTEKNTDQLRLEVVGDSLKKAQDNTLKTFTITVISINDAPALKQKAEEQIERAGVAISEANSTMQEVSTARGITWDPTPGAVSDLDVAVSNTDNDSPGVKITVPKQTQGATFGEKTKASGSISGKELVDAITVTGVDDSLPDGPQNYKIIARAKDHLESAKKAFAEGKYGKAYGLARSAEAMVAGINGTRDPDNQAAGKEFKVKTAPTGESTGSPKTPESPVNKVIINGDSILENDETFSTKVQTKTEIDTITKLTSSVNPSTSGQSVTFTAIVTGGATPTGSVNFLQNDVTNLGSGELNKSGVATLTTSSLAVGTHTVTATYVGNSAYKASKGSISFTVGDVETSAGIGNPDVSAGTGSPAY